MSLHYEWILSLRLRPDTPESFLDELRFHLGMVDERPSEPSLECEWPCLLPDQDAALPGGAIRSLVHQQPYLGHPASMGLYVRTFVLDDGMYELLQAVPAWLAPWSLTQGWIGHAREEFDLHPWLYFYVQDGHAYTAEPGGRKSSPLTTVLRRSRSCRRQTFRLCRTVPDLTMWLLGVQGLRYDSAPKIERLRHGGWAA